jgi:hypothetical protein
MKLRPGKYWMLTAIPAGRRISKYDVSDSENDVSDSDSECDVSNSENDVSDSDPDYDVSD